MRQPRRFFMTMAVVGVFVALATSGCEEEPEGIVQTTFAAPEEAGKALVRALEHNDATMLRRLLGQGSDDLVYSGDAVADRVAREAFLNRYREQHTWVAGGPHDLVLQVGSDRWPLPIPLRERNGHWYFDGKEGAREVVLRRIGSNELRTIDVMRGFVAAQREYAATGHDGQPPGLYATKLQSDVGKQNGLYWQPRLGEPESPAGPFLAAAVAEGYSGTRGNVEPYHGYLYKILLAQGAAANGGARNYMSDGQLKSGFAVLAYPAVYGSSGVMSFIVNQDGVVWQRDLGRHTVTFAEALDQFNPDTTWTPIAPEG